MLVIVVMPSKQSAIVPVLDGMRTYMELICQFLPGQHPIFAQTIKEAFKTMRPADALHCRYIEPVPLAGKHPLGVEKLCDFKVGMFIEQPIDCCDHVRRGRV